MQFTRIEEVCDFLACVNKSTGQVWLEDQEGNKINLKSALSQYIAVAALLQNNKSQMMLFANSPRMSSCFLISSQNILQWRFNYVDFNACSFPRMFHFMGMRRANPRLRRTLSNGCN